MEEDVDWSGGMPSWCDERKVEDLVKFINAPSKPPTKHEQKRSRKIERRWRRWATRLLRSYVRTIRRRWRRCLTRLLIDEYREYVRAIPWSRCARRLLLDGRHYSLCTMQAIRTRWRTLTAGYLHVCRTARRMALGCGKETRGVLSAACSGCVDLAVLETAVARDACRDRRLRVEFDQ